jgi:transposase-like protein
MERSERLDVGHRRRGYRRIAESVVSVVSVARRSPRRAPDVPARLALAARAAAADPSDAIANIRSTTMTHAPHLRDACRRLRVEQGLTIDELAERLALPRTTVYGWVRDLPAPPRLANPGQRLGTLAMQAKYQALRDQAYAEGWRIGPPSRSSPASGTSSACTSPRVPSATATRSRSATPTLR